MEIIAKLIVPAGDAPDRAIVTKRTGAKPLLIRDNVDVWHHHGEKQTISTNGCRFLVDPNSGCINAISSDVEVVWLVQEHEADDLRCYLGWKEF